MPRSKPGGVPEQKGWIGPDGTEPEAQPGVPFKYKGKYRGNLQVANPTVPLDWAVLNPGINLTLPDYGQCVWCEINSDWRLFLEGWYGAELDSQTWEINLSGTIFGRSGMDLDDQQEVEQAQRDVALAAIHLGVWGDGLGYTEVDIPDPWGKQATFFWTGPNHAYGIVRFTKLNHGKLKTEIACYPHPDGGAYRRPSLVVRPGLSPIIKYLKCSGVVGMSMEPETPKFSEGEAGSGLRSLPHIVVPEPAPPAPLTPMFVKNQPGLYKNPFTDGIMTGWRQDVEKSGYVCWTFDYTDGTVLTTDKNPETLFIETADYKDFLSVKIMGNSGSTPSVTLPPVRIEQSTIAAIVGGASAEEATRAQIKVEKTKGTAPRPPKFDYKKEPWAKSPTKTPEQIEQEKAENTAANEAEFVAIEEDIDTVNEQDTTGRKGIMVRLPEDLKNEMHAAAGSDEVSANAWMVRLIRNELAHRKHEAGEPLIQGATNFEAKIRFEMEPKGDVGFAILNVNDNLADLMAASGATDVSVTIEVPRAPEPTVSWDPARMMSQADYELLNANLRDSEKPGVLAIDVNTPYVEAMAKIETAIKGLNQDAYKKLGELIENRYLTPGTLWTQTHSSGTNLAALINDLYSSYSVMPNGIRMASAGTVNKKIDPVLTTFEMTMPDGVTKTFTAVDLAQTPKNRAERRARPGNPKNAPKGGRTTEKMRGPSTNAVILDEVAPASQTVPENLVLPDGIDALRQKMLAAEAQVAHQLFDDLSDTDFMDAPPPVTLESLKAIAAESGARIGKAGVPEPPVNAFAEMQAQARAAKGLGEDIS